MQICTRTYEYEYHAARKEKKQEILHVVLCIVCKDESGTYVRTYVYLSSTGSVKQCAVGTSDG